MAKILKSIGKNIVSNRVRKRRNSSWFIASPYMTSGIVAGVDTLTKILASLSSMRTKNMVEERSARIVVTIPQIFKTASIIVINCGVGISESREQSYCI